MRTVAVVTACGLLLVGCGSDPGAAPPSGATSSATSSATAPSSPLPSPSGNSTSPDNHSASPALAGTGVKTATTSDFGTILFDRTGQAIYLFDKEKSQTSACYGACAEAWPPVLTKALPEAVGEVKQSLLGTTTRTDGTTQVTYGGHPLYFYAHEGKNEVKCHNVEGFDGQWLVVTPAGEAAPA
jgi:predicted lipoprotein with Yx(FWY)xxD motif